MELVTNDLLYDFDKSISNFFNWVRLCCGFSEESDTYVILKHIIVEQEDLDNFIDNYYDGNFNDLLGNGLKMLRSLRTSDA